MYTLVHTMNVKTFYINIMHGNVTYMIITCWLFLLKWLTTYLVFLAVPKCNKYYDFNTVLKIKTNITDRIYINTQ